MKKWETVLRVTTEYVYWVEADTEIEAKARVREICEGDNYADAPEFEDVEEPTEEIVQCSPVVRLDKMVEAQGMKLVYNQEDLAEAIRTGEAAEIEVRA